MIQVEESGGERYWVGNPDFTRLFFPSGMKRLPPPNKVPVIKGPDTKRYMLVGGSAAAGDPDADFSIARVLEWILATTHPETNWEILNLAYTACNSHVAAEVVRQSGPYDLDGILVLVGNNEVIGPFGPGTTLTGQLPSRARSRWQVRLRKTRLGQLAQDLRESMQGPDGEPESWRGMQAFLEHRVDAGDSRLQEVYRNFRMNLEDIGLAARERDLPVLLSDVPVNLVDQPPFFDDPSKLPELLRERVVEFLNTGRTPLSIEDVLQAASIHDHSAYLNYMTGQLLLGAGQLDEAERFLKTARDLDQLRFRTDSEIEEIIRNIQDSGDPPWIPVDATRPLIEDSPKKSLGFPHFYEHVHFSFRANFLIAREFAGALLETEGLNAESLDAINWNEAAAGLAYTPYDTWLILEEMEKRFALPPFTQIPGYGRITAWMDQLRTLLHERISKAEEKARMQETYMAAIQARPDDHRLKLNFANFLKAFGRPEAAFEIMDAIHDDNPGDGELTIAWFSICLDLKKPALAREAFERIIKLFPEHPNIAAFREQLEELEKQTGDAPG
ncbi:MAG: tetratricopeptide repeat protein [Oceanipulchritudo sp.]